jgi:diacylglycerol O-acyltransferase
VTALSFDRPSNYDLGYLARESPVQPLHYVMQLEVDGVLTVDEVRGHVLDRLSVVPVMQRTLRYPLGGGRPVWVDDPAFDIARQVYAYDTAGGKLDLAEALLRMTTTPVARGGPLWRIVVGSRGDRTYLWLSVQHAMMDGGLLSVTLQDLFAETDTAPQVWTPRPGPSPLSLRVAQERARIARLLKRSKGSASSPPVRRSPGPASETRALAQLSLDMDELSAYRKRVGATVNEVYLTAVAGGLRRYLEPPRDLLTIIPRDTRPEGEANAIGNRHVAMVLTLPVLTEDPRAAMVDVHEQTTSKKSAARTAGDERLGVELVCTNVRWRGRHVVAGRPVLSYHAGVPLQESRLAVLAMSYENHLAVDFTADASAFPDVDRLAAYTLETYREMIGSG